MSTPLEVWVPGGGPMIEHAQQALKEAVVLHCTPDVPEAAPRVRLLVSGTPDAAWLDALPALEAVVIPYSGVPPKTAALMAKHPQVALHNLHHNAEPTAEMAVALLLAVAKRVVPADQELRCGDWGFRYREPDTWTLADRRAVVFGWGAIGRRVGRTLEALGMHVTAVGRTARTESDGRRIVGCDQLDEGLGGADVLMITAAATPDTRGLFNAARLASLSRGALVVNVARGTLLDESALFVALQSGQVGGAGLDVWWRYPRDEASRGDCAPAAHAFHDLPQVVFSPHRGGLTVETERRRGQGLARLLDQAARGEGLDNPVDRDVGY